MKYRVQLQPQNHAHIFLKATKINFHDCRTWCISVRKRRMKRNYRIMYTDFIFSIICFCDDIRSVDLFQVTYAVLYEITSVSTILLDGA